MSGSHPQRVVALFHRVASSSEHAVRWLEMKETRTVVLPQQHLGGMVRGSGNLRVGRSPSKICTFQQCTSVESGHHGRCMLPFRHSPLFNAYKVGHDYAQAAPVRLATLTVSQAGTDESLITAMLAEILQELWQFEQTTSKRQVVPVSCQAYKDTQVGPKCGPTSEVA